MEQFFNALASSFTIKSLLYVTLGVVWGMVGGAIPGISGSVAMALLLPMTRGMDAVYALPMLAAVYVGAEYGGSIPSILIKTPGTGGNAVTTLDGYAMRLQGRGGEALFTSLFSGFVGGIISVLLLVFLCIPLASFGLKFDSVDYMLLGLLGLTIVGAVSGPNPVKGLISALFGLAISRIGMDNFCSTSRFTFGMWQLSSGLSTIPVLVGLFAVSTVFRNFLRGEGGKTYPKDKSTGMKFLKANDFKKILPVNIMGGVVGTVVGAIPAAGGAVAAWLCYSEAKMFCRNTENFGKGDIRGVAAPESANNAVPAGALIPLLALGIPGSNSTAILLAGFTMAGVQPGPLLFVQHPEIPYTLMACMLYAQFIMLVTGMLIIRPCLTLTSINGYRLNLAVLMFAMMGSYSINNRVFDLYITLIFGVIGLFLRRYGFVPSATVLGFILGAMVEDNLRRAVVLAKGGSIIKTTLSTVLLILVICSLFLPYIMNWRKKRKKTKEAQKE